MTMYSDSNVSTKYIDPQIYTPNARTTFQLDASEAAYLPNMRLINLGVNSPTGANQYNGITGALGLIKNIRLMDGKTVLCSANEAQFYTAFRNINTSNERNQSVMSQQQCTTLGLTVDGANNKITRMARVLGTAVLLKDTDSGSIELSTILPMLSAVSHLPTAVFTNLNLQIEYYTGTQVIDDTTIAVDTIRPILVVDVIDNPVIVDNLNARLKSASWLEVEHDLFIIPAAADTAAADNGVVQNVNVQLNGFNNKRVERLLITKEASPLNVEAAAQVKGFGIFGSQSCFRQKLQFRVNGRNLLPREGIVGNNERLAHIVDHYGDCSAYIGSNQYGTDPTPVLSDGLNLLGMVDFMGTYIGEYINNLQIRYQRTGLQDNATRRSTTQALTAHVYGEVRKMIQVGGPTGYRISYQQ